MPAELTKPLPYYRWYVKDWRANRRVRNHLSWQQRGAYRELIDECWLEGSIPSDLPSLAEIVGCSVGEMREMWTGGLQAFFVEREPGHLVNLRIERERTEADAVRVERVRAGRAGGFAKRIGESAQGDLLAEVPAAKQMPNRIKRRGEKSREEKSREEELPTTSSDAAMAAKAVVDAWNAMAKVRGYAKVTAVKGYRRVHLTARLQEPGWTALATRAIAYLDTDPWYREHRDAARFDVLIRPGKAEYYCERAEVERSRDTGSATSRGGARAGVDSGIHDELAAGGGSVADEGDESR